MLSDQIVVGFWNNILSYVTKKICPKMESVFRQHFPVRPSWIICEGYTFDDDSAIWKTNYQILRMYP